MFNFCLIEWDLPSVRTLRRSSWPFGTSRGCAHSLRLTLENRRFERAYEARCDALFLRAKRVDAHLILTGVRIARCVALVVHAKREDARLILDGARLKSDDSFGDLRSVIPYHPLFLLIL